MISPYVFAGLASVQDANLNIKPQLLIKLAAIHYGVKEDDILGRGRVREIVRARHSLMFTLIKLMGMSTSQAAKLIGNRDHSTAINSNKAHLDEIETDLEERERYELFLKSASTNLFWLYKQKYNFDKKVFTQMPSAPARVIDADFGRKVFLGEI